MKTDPKKMKKKNQKMKTMKEMTGLHRVSVEGADCQEEPIPFGPKGTMMKRVGDQSRVQRLDTELSWSLSLSWMILVMLLELVKQRVSRTKRCR